MLKASSSIAVAVLVLGAAAGSAPAKADVGDWIIGELNRRLDRVERDTDKIEQKLEQQRRNFKERGYY